MILAIDIGNTNIVIGCCQDDTIKFTERVSTNRSATELEYAIFLKTVLELYGVSAESINGAIISSVVPSLTHTMKNAAAKITGCDAMIVGPGVKTGVNIVIDDPAQLGSDLAVAAAAAICEYPVPLIIIDMGTATTVSVIDERKNYIGGMILPGVATSLESLASMTSQLPRISAEVPKKLIGSNTVDCMQSGILYGSAAQMDGLISRINEDRKMTHTVVATGGLARLIAPLCREKIILDDDLLLKGLTVIYSKNS